MAHRDDAWIEGLDEKSYRYHTIRALERIEENVEETNHRVSALENWRWAMTGGFFVVAIAVIPMAMELIAKLR